MLSQATAKRGERAPPSVNRHALRQRNSRVSGLETRSSPYFLLAFIPLCNNDLEDLIAAAGTVDEWALTLRGCGDRGR